IDIIERQFRKYVDKHKHLLDKEVNSFEKICKRYAFDYPDTSYKYILKDKLSEKLKEKATVSENFKRDKLRILVKQLILKFMVENIEIHPYLEVLEEINARLQNGILIVDMNNEAQWNEIIQITMDIINLSEENELFKHPLEWYERTYKVGKSTQYLMGKGYKFKVENTRVISQEDDYLRIALEIEKYVIELGGINIAEFMLKKLSSSFNPRLQRFMKVRRYSGFTTEQKVEPEIPWGYLFALCVKHFVRRNFKKDAVQIFNKKIEELFKLATAYISMLDIQEYSKFGHMFVQTDKLVEYVRDNVLFDNIILFPQWNPKYIPLMMEGLLKEFFDTKEVKSSLKFSFEELLLVVKESLKSSSVNSLSFISKRSLKQTANHISNSSLHNIFSILSHNRNKLNSEYIVPNNLNEFFLKPFIKVNEDQYMMLHPSLCAFSFFEAVCNELRKFIPNFDNQLGLKFEDFIKITLEQNEIEYSSGYYGNDGECDLIIETPEKVIFIEVKKKALTRTALAGYDINIFEDISKSLISSQKQLGAHELALVRDKEIILREKRSAKKGKQGTIKKIEWKDRIIHRVSVSLNEYGFFNDHSVTKNILETIVQGEVHAVDPEKDKQLEQLRKHTRELIGQIEELRQLQGEEIERWIPFFDCSFYSLNQLLMVINDSHSTESFVDNLFTTHHVTLSTLDFYLEYEYWRNIRKG
ncbi:hypothetical protein, partial [Aneurinibacillus danicus]|uniref:hypothetical protein n=1 Tax=Aneurinibacillus danicus TaxID=267746 RepID=UPI0014786920